MWNYEDFLACPACLGKISRGHRQKCHLKKVTFTKVDSIWNFVDGKRLSKSQAENELMHAGGTWGRIADGSYEILAAFARGNRTLDVACGEGWIEQLAPETVGVDFSISALRKAQTNGAKYLVCADAQKLPFVDNAFDLAICAGSLENIKTPQKALNEMMRVSKIQVLTVHREFNLATRMLRNFLTRFFSIQNQPVENPLTLGELETLMVNANLKIVFKGVWTLPVNYGRVVKFLPEFKNIPSCFFVITIKR